MTLVSSSAAALFVNVSARNPDRGQDVVWARCRILCESTQVLPGVCVCVCVCVSVHVYVYVCVCVCMCMPMRMWMCVCGLPNSNRLENIMLYGLKWYDIM